MDRSQAVCLCIVLCLAKIMVVMLIVNMFRSSLDATTTNHDQVDENGYCLHRNSPVKLPVFAERDWLLITPQTEVIQFSSNHLAEFTAIESNSAKHLQLIPKTTDSDVDKNELEEEKKRSTYRLNVYQDEFELHNIYTLSPSLQMIGEQTYDLEVQLLYHQIRAANEKKQQQSESKNGEKKPVNSNKLIVSLLMNYKYPHESGFSPQNSDFFKPMLNALKSTHASNTHGSKHGDSNKQTLTAKIFGDRVHETEAATKLDDSQYERRQYFAYLASSTLPPCTGQKEIPHIVIDMDAQYGDNVEPIFMKHDDLLSIVSYLQNTTAAAKKISMDKDDIQRWENIEDRAVLPNDGVVSKYFDERKVFQDKRSFWRAISTALLRAGNDMNDEKQSEIELEIASYTLQKRVVNEILNVKQFLNAQLRKYHYDECIHHGEQQMPSTSEPSKGERANKQNSKEHDQQQAQKPVDCNEVSDLFTSKWEMRQESLMCIKPFECDGNKKQITRHALMKAFDSIDKNVALINWLAPWFGNVAYHNVDGDEARILKQSGNDHSAAEHINLIKFDASTNKYYYDGVVQQVDNMQTANGERIPSQVMTAMKNLNSQSK